MHHIPKPQDQARILAKALKNLNVDVKHQDALELIAKVMGHKNWKTMSAAIDATPAVAPSAAIPHTIPDILGPADGDVYEALVTVDMTLSARIKVRADSPEEAQTLLREAGAAQYPRGFEVDENYRGSCDFYLGDPDDITNLSEVEYSSEGNHYGSATWADERYSYKLEISRSEPDNSDEDESSNCTLTLTISAENGVKVTLEDDDYEIHNDDLAEWLEEACDEGDFDDKIDDLIEKLEKKLSK